MPGSREPTSFQSSAAEMQHFCSVLCGLLGPIFDRVWQCFYASIIDEAPTIFFSNLMLNVIKNHHCSCSHPQCFTMFDSEISMFHHLSLKHRRFPLSRRFRNAALTLLFMAALTASAASWAACCGAPASWRWNVRVMSLFNDFILSTYRNIL